MNLLSDWFSEFDDREDGMKISLAKANITHWMVARGAQCFGCDLIKH